MTRKINVDLFKKLIDEADSISICSHISPDGDAVGSSTGLYLALKDLGKEVYLIKNDDFPSNLSFIGNKEYYTDKEPFETDLYIVVDLSDAPRSGIGAEYEKLAKTSLCIDHHQVQTSYCDHDIIVSDISSSCELVTNLLLGAGYNINEQAATFLYLGISTDTHRFQYDSSDADTLRTAAKLLDLGADKNFINLSLYENLNVNYLQLQAEVISKSKIFKDGKFILGRLTKDQLEKYNLDNATTEGLVSILKSISGIELSCIVKEHDDKDQKISFRSKESIDVSKLAKEFGGGGHIRASGCTILEDNETAYNKVLERLEKIEC